MKKIIFLTILTIFLFLFQTNFVLANSEDNHKSEIEEGRNLVESEVGCDQLNDEQLEYIGEYLMEQMHPGESHNAMHKMMGIEEKTEEHKNFHINIAKTMYCGEGGTTSMMPMMKMMGGGGNSMMGNIMSGSNWGMGTGWGIMGGFGWIFMILFWVLVIVGIVALIKWLFNQTKTGDKSKMALDILGERYAKGEIDKKEFEEKKKDLIS